MNQKTQRWNQVKIGLAISAFTYFLLICIFCLAYAREHQGESSAYSGTIDFIAEGVLGGIFWQIGVSILLSVIAFCYRYYRLMWGITLGWLIPGLLIGSFFLMLRLGGGIHVM